MRAASSIALLALLSAGCVGETSRQDFIDEVRSRGGGVDLDVVGASLDTLTDELGGDPEILGLTYTPLTTGVSLRARNTGTEDEVDSWSFVGGGVRARTPVPTDTVRDLAAHAFPASAVDLDVIGAAVADSRERAGIDGGWVEEVAIAVEVDSEVPDRRRPVLTVTVEDDRAMAEIRFDLEGRFLGQEGP